MATDPRPAATATSGRLPEAPSPAEAAPSALEAAAICGPYRLLAELGRGGMGVVHRAVRLAPDLPQPVALKRLIGRFDDAAIGRFRRERRLLARLQHPAIARLYDGGTDEQGVPYLVMELVDGEPLTIAADRRRMSIEQRVDLFVEVCEAVDAAHRALVVHRDLKPSNILVTSDGHAKLLDFGIARLVDPEITDSPPPTREGPGALTPEYAAPEQIRGELPGIAADVFALGVVLCELLTGRRPWKGGTDRWRQPDAEPLRPSQLLADPDALAALAQERATTPGAVRRVLTGDLGAIVRKALELEPDRRYPSAAALRDDLQRWRRAEPVEARPTSLLYRARLFSRRYRWPVATASAVALGLVGGIAGTSWQAHIARREVRRTEAVRDFLVRIFEQADPDGERGPSLPVGDVLAQGRLRLDSELGEDPATRAALRGTLARVYESLGETDQAIALARAAQTDFGALGETDTPAARSVELSLARLDLARQAWDGARQRLAGLRPELDRPGVAERSEFLALLAVLTAQDGEADKALALQHAALEAARAEGDDEEERRRLVELSELLRSTRNLGDGERRLAEAREVLEELRRTVPADTRLASDLLHGLGTTHVQSGRYSDGIALLEEAMELRTRLLGANHPDTLSSTSELANAKTYSSDLAGAARLFDTLEQRLAEAHGPEHSQVATALNNRGLLEYNRGEFGPAMEHFARAAAIFEKAVGPNHEWTLAALSNAAGSAGDLGRWEEAEARLREALARTEAAYGPKANGVASVLGNLGILRRRRGDPAEAVALHRRQLAIYTANLGAAHDFSTGALLQECWALLDLGDPASLRSVIDRLQPTLATAIAEGQSGAGIANERMTLGRALLRSGRLSEAEPLLEQALAERDKLHTAPHWRRAELRLAVAGLYQRQGRRAEAAALRRAAHDELVSALGSPASAPPHPLIAYLERTVP